MEDEEGRENGEKAKVQPDARNSPRVVAARALFSKMAASELLESYHAVLSLLKVNFVGKVPAEVAEQIFSYLDICDLKKCELVSQKWRSVILDGPTWKNAFNRIHQKNPTAPVLIQRLQLPSLTVPNEWKRGCQLLTEGTTRLQRNWKKKKYQSTVISCNADGIYCLQYDEEKIVTGNRDNTIKIWDMETNCLEASIPGHEGSVLCLQYDEKKIITSSSDSTIRIWDMADFKCKAVIRHHSDSVLHVRFDDEFMVSCSKDKTIVIWEKGKSEFEYHQRHKLEGHRAAVNVVEFDKRFVVSASGDRVIKIWRPQTGELVRTLTGHERGIACIHYRGDYIVSGSSDKSLIVWEVETGRILRRLRGHTDLVRCVRFNERYIISGSYDTTIRVWDFESGVQKFSLQAHSSRVFRIQFDDFRIISSSQDDTIIKWEFDRGLRQFLEDTEDLLERMDGVSLEGPSDTSSNDPANESSNEGGIQPASFDADEVDSKTPGRHTDV